MRYFDRTNDAWGQIASREPNLTIWKRKRRVDLASRDECLQENVGCRFGKAGLGGVHVVAKALQQAPPFPATEVCISPGMDSLKEFEALTAFLGVW